MEIKSIRLENVGQFSDIELNIAPIDKSKIRSTVIIGNNGAGKSTILESIATSLSWYVARIRSEKGVGSPISELKIKNDASSSSITIEVNDNKLEKISWIISKAKKGRKLEKNTRLENLNKLVNSSRENYTQNPNFSFPILVFYDANRGVLDIPLKIRTKHTFSQLDGYDNSLKGIVDYRRFFEWFREREDIENQDKLRFFDNFNKFEKINFEEFEKQLIALTDRQLESVRKALTTFLPEFNNLRVERKPRLHMAINKNDAKLNMEQLSQGEKLTLAMVGDIARRLAIMNPELENPLLGEGIILIDEAELHLHPRWQRIFINRINNTFPNCQFILTTHSPLLVSDYKDVLCYSLDNGEFTMLESLYGLDVNQVLSDAMDTDIRNTEIDNLINKFLENIENRDLQSAKKNLHKLEENLPSDHFEIIKAKLLIKRLELQR